MTVVVERQGDQLPNAPGSAGTANATVALAAAQPRNHRWAYLAPVLLSVVNATLFMIYRPGVEDLWAARARASAAAHGVGLTYWFSWFGGAATPGNYSIISPYLSALLSAELLGALSAIAITVLCIPLLRGTNYPVAGVLVAAIASGSNLWSGRVPFLLGTAFAVATFLAVRHQRRILAGAAGVLSVFASPVSGAFIALGLVAVFLVRKDHRRISAITLGIVAVSMVVVAAVFGNPGPEHFTHILCAEMILGMILCLFARPSDYVRTAVWLAVITAFVLVVVPNGMGSNVARLAWFYLPVVIVATSSRKLWIALLVIAPVLIGGVDGSVIDVRHATQPMSSSSYYTALATELDTRPDLRNYRLEVVTLGSHAADEALLNHAMLARGWETQEDDRLNSILMSRQLLNSVSYKVWLQNNAVGYVAIPRSNRDTYPEYNLVTGVTSGPLSYLTKVWENPDWYLFKVTDPNPIVGVPATMVAHTQSKLTIKVNCACTFDVRVRWSNFLRATPTVGTVPATVSEDGTGWTSITTTKPGTYELHGTIARLFD
jgi:hypothetical protein